MQATRRFLRSIAFALYFGAALVGGATFEMTLPDDAEAGYDNIDESYFYVSLSADGQWVQNPQFGWVWYPYNRPAGWRPYTVGRWVWTEYGEWMWVSDEPYGWATYHYGRWFLDPFYGWVWLPGRVWAPAWVSWRDCDDYIGWAPLGPWGYYDRYHHRYRDWDNWHHNHHDWDEHHGYRGDRDDSDDWNFTRKRDFADTRIDRVVVDRRHLPDLIRRSRDLPAPSEQEEREGRGVSRGIDKQVIEHAAGRPIHAVKVEDAPEPPRGQGGGRQDSPAGRGGKTEDRPDRVRVFRPQIAEAKPDRTPDRLGIAKPDRSAEGGRGGGSNARDHGAIRGGQRGEVGGANDDGAGRPEKAGNGPDRGNAADKMERPNRGPGGGGGGSMNRDGNAPDDRPQHGKPSGFGGAPRSNEPARGDDAQPRVHEPMHGQQTQPRVHEPARGAGGVNEPRVHEPMHGDADPPRMHQPRGGADESPMRGQGSSPRMHGGGGTGDRVETPPQHAPQVREHAPAMHERAPTYERAPSPVHERAPSPVYERAPSPVREPAPSMHREQMPSGGGSHNHGASRGDGGHSMGQPPVSPSGSYGSPGSYNAGGSPGGSYNPGGSTNPGGSFGGSPGGGGGMGPHGGGGGGGGRGH